MAVKVKGLAEVSRKLRAEIQKIEGGTRKGMQKVGILIKGDAQAITPKDYGVLVNSAFCSTDNGTGRGPRLRVGYTAKYAPWVHEMPMTLRGEPRSDFGTTRAGTSFGGGSGKGVYWQGGENKFLEKAVKRNQNDILRVIQREAMIK